MEKIEVLSPVGEINSFYSSINAGADAVYMGLPKFNARMRAENITLENLENLVTFAHLKGVKVYITLNTLLSNSELKDAVKLAGKALQTGVDAFIVQDVGLITMLKLAYPNIVLHGSTQLGVHNVRGALMAKQLGLTRVVLSRECTLKDIKAIRENVDIEIEVFVQGANCICFSGNCYLSSLKTGASGNRGKCKQLCRLPYTLTDGKNKVDGYTLSPRDNCMLPCLKSLISLGVSSLKIEGRLRQPGYVAVATSVYRRAVDKILNQPVALNSKMEMPMSNFSNEKINNTDNLQAIDLQTKMNDLSEKEILDFTNELKRVFARGEYVAGYNDGNNIIDYTHNNHLGIKIGVVKNVTRFKDLFKVTMDINRPIVQGDGLKFVGKSVVNVGVGNIEKNGKFVCVFVKNAVDIGSSVYLSHDTIFESQVPKFERLRSLSIHAKVMAGSPIEVIFKSGETKVTFSGDIVENAQTRPLTAEKITEQLTKVELGIWKVIRTKIETDNAYVSVSALNEIRRNLIVELTNKICETEYPCKYTESDIDNIFNKFKIAIRETSFNSLAIIDENTNLNVANKYEALILSPTDYSLSTIDNFAKKYFEKFKAPLIINLPIVARADDINVIDKIVEKFKSKNVIFIANNIYAMSYAKDACVWAGSGLNIVNDYSATAYNHFGAKEIIAPIEKWTSRLNGTYKLSGRMTLMTLTSCPVKVLHNNSCLSCAYNSNIKFLGTVGELKVRRIKIANCYFELIDSISANGDISDLRN